ncbi:MAG TPA: cytochrome b [Vitreimonas sp.]|uniref:cytochrome b n=1 Tax=Vitreimonas sp. TaxID=3069702 RepID=UPI002D5008FF|nr:cytochrome b [Vitreimonas sp.]HYD87181.1 cytochrome b [Vitreimonas sp.]
MTAADAAQQSREEGEVTRSHYHPIGIFFHWTMAAMVLFQLWWGWRTSWLPAGYDKLDAYGVHALVGAVLLVFAFMRAGWRCIAPFILPDLEDPEDMPGWQHFAAQAVHVGLYVLMFVLPFTGWLMLSAAGGDSIRMAFGLELPSLPFVAELGFVERAHLEQWAETLHFWSVWAIMGLLAMHIGAALHHHFINQDDVLARMVPVLLSEAAAKRHLTRGNLDRPKEKQTPQPPRSR